MATQHQKQNRAARVKVALGGLLLLITLIGPQLIVEWLK